MLKIGELSKLSKTTIKAIRYYDEINLLKPKLVDESGYRYYDLDDLNKLIKIVELRNLDMPISEIKKIMAGNNEKEVLNNHLSTLKDNLLKTQNNISKLSNILDKYNEEIKMEKYVINEILIPDYNVYYRHGVIPYMDSISEFVLQAGFEVGKNNPNLKCLPYCYVTYTAKEYKEKDVELEYVEAVEKIGLESENIKFKHVLGGKAISVKHKGPYSELNKAYSFILDYVKTKGYEIKDDIREVYIDGCWNKDSEEDYLTEIQVLIK